MFNRTLDMVNISLKRFKRISIYKPLNADTSRLTQFDHNEGPRLRGQLELTHRLSSSLIPEKLGNPFNIAAFSRVMQFL